MPKAALGLLLLVVVIAGFALLTAARRNTADIPPLVSGASVNFSTAKQYFENRIQAAGAKKAYQEMLSYAESFPIGEGHAISHAFGAALFETNGVSELSVCGNDLLWGCFHELVDRAIAARGLQVIPQLKQVCDSAGRALTGCEHGIGHGFQGYFGYRIGDLKQALSACDLLEPGHPRNGCSDGAFMEYNLREEAATSSVAYPRQFSPENAYGPCLQIPNKYGTSCSFELPFWWLSTPPFRSNSFYQMSARCAGLKELERAACFEGVGFLAFETGGNGASLCASYTDMTSADRVHCLSSYALGESLYSSTTSEVLCKNTGLSGSSLAYCISYLGSDERNRDSIPLPF